MKIFSRSNIDIGQIKKEQKEYQEDRERREALNISQRNEYNSYCYRFAGEIEKRLKDILAEDFLKIPGANLQVDYYDYDYDKSTQYIVRLAYEHYGLSGNNRISWHVFLSISIDNATYEFKVATTNNIDMNINSQFNDYELLESTYNLVKHVSELDWDSIISKVIEGFPRYGDTVKEPEPERSRWSEYDEKINKEIVNRFAGEDIWIKVDIFRNWYDYYFKINSFEDRFIICDLAIIDNHNELSKIERNCNYAFDDFVTTYPLELLTTDELYDTYPRAENYAETDMEGNP